MLCLVLRKKKFFGLVQCLAWEFNLTIWTLNFFRYLVEENCFNTICYRFLFQNRVHIKFALFAWICSLSIIDRMYRII